MIGHGISGQRDQKRGGRVIESRIRDASYILGRGYRLERAGVSSPRIELVSAKLGSGVPKQISGQKFRDQWSSGNGRTRVRNRGANQNANFGIPKLSGRTISDNNSDGQQLIFSGNFGQHTCLKNFFRKNW